MTPEERSRLEAIDTILRRQEVRAQIQPIIARVRAELSRNPDAVMTWEPIPLTTFRCALPEGIRSSWVFILRAGANTGAERHPNSHQRMMSFAGTGDMQIQEIAADTAAPTAQRWQSNVLVSDPDAPLERKWISIPTDCWHQPVIPDDSDWVVVSFHTVPADELVEERPVGREGGETKQMVYLSEN
jgi:hypothetical protein